MSVTVAWLFRMEIVHLRLRTLLVRFLAEVNVRNDRLHTVMHQGSPHTPR